ncbi:MAG: ankyrin repeat domain-containing protein [Rickettsiales bacterium]|nr:MAG: ankyrin repeat domain-containing protein [Rickettsiales bacterium]
MAKQIIDNPLNEANFLNIIRSPETIVQNLDYLTTLLYSKKISNDAVNKGVIMLVSLPNKINNMFLHFILKFKLADMNATDEFGKSALNVAISAHNNEAVKVLLEHEASIECHGTIENYNSPLRVAIACHNNVAYDLLTQKGAPIDFNNAANYFKVALGLSNEYVLQNLFQNHISKLKEPIDDLMINQFCTLNKNILELLINQGVKKKSLEKTFIKVISINDPNNLKDIFINKGVDIARAFDNEPDINWESSLVRKYALDINHKYSELIKVLDNKDTTIDQYKEYFYKAKEIKKACKDDFNIDQIMHQIFLQAGKELISAIIKETPQTEHKDLVKWLNVFGAGFSFYNSEKILLTSQAACNESKSYQKDLKDNFINFKERSQVEIRDGKLHNAHTGDIINGSNDKEFLYVIDKKGQLYINVNDINVNNHSAFHHSFILNGYNKNHTLEGISMFGYGKPAACAGHLKIQDGIIIYINNGSGHYKPDLNMFMQACHKLLNEKVLDTNFILTDYQNNPVSFNEFNVDEVLATGEYFFLDY